MKILYTVAVLIVWTCMAMTVVAVCFGMEFR